ncbi:MAG: ATPase [Pseudomonadales bacterium]|nr:ATPase [Pseudomonadales bacterium]
MSLRIKLEKYLSEMGPIAIAVSGGVDSMTLAVLANRSNPATQIFHAKSPAVPEQATERVKRYAKQENWELSILNAGEINDVRYRANPVNRCYFCKSNLYRELSSNTSHQILSGTNLDDLGDYRPGLIAAKENNVCHPYVELGIDKNTLRLFAKELNLDDLYQLPSAPCLASRVETGIAIDAEMLPLINQTEEAIWTALKGRIALKGVRCRMRKAGITIELDLEGEGESNTNIDHEASYARESREIALHNFSDSKWKINASDITIDSYKRGSAFLIEALELG